MRNFREIKYFIYIKKSGKFCNEWYLGNNPDVAEARKNSFWYKLERSGIPLISHFGKYMAHPLRHYIKYGCYEHRAPTPFFDIKKYCFNFRDVNMEQINLFYHFVRYGIAEGRGDLFDKSVNELMEKSHQRLGVKFCTLRPEDMELTDLGDKTIAVHLHLYYVELADEMISYLKNIPRKFDLFVSVVNRDPAEIKALFEGKIEQMNSITVENGPNRGRDVAPMLITFGKRLQKYDFCCHFHTKKSPHDSRLKGWRKYLLDTILGSEKQVTGILNLLNKDGKFVYQKPFFNTPDRSNWLSNFKLACRYFESKGIAIDDYKVVEFPQGSFFWCRGSALTRLLNLELQWSDFPEEPIAPDGTIAHVLERSILILADDIDGAAYRLEESVTDGAFPRSSSQDGK